MKVGNSGSILTPVQKIDLHKAYWSRASIKRPLVTFHLAEDFFFSRHYKAAENLLVAGNKITPEMLDVDLFMEDYETMFQNMIEIPQDGFWSAQPFTGIPWMEAILGCEVIATESSFITEPFLQSHRDIGKLTLDNENTWLQKYIEFIEKLEQVSGGRFPIGQPIMRGPSDMIGSVMGQTEMVFAFMEDPEGMRRVAENVTGIYLKVIESQFSVLSDFHGGYSMGFYHLWCPGKCIWFQEDLSAILSPTIYCNGLKSSAEKICRDYDFTSVHLHPSSFFILDDLMSVDRLSVIEINKDVNGPTIEDMVPVFEKVLSSKNLMIWGELDEIDLTCIVNKLRPEGVFLNIIAPDEARARELVEFMNI